MNPKPHAHDAPALMYGFAAALSFRMLFKGQSQFAGLVSDVDAAGEHGYG